MANILFVAYDYPPILSPESIQVQRRALTLANNGHNVIILTSHEKPSFEFIDETLIEEHKNIKVVKTKKPFLEKGLNLIFKILDITDRKYWWKWFTIKNAKQLIQKYNINIVYTHATPLVDHLVGYEIKNIFPELKWIAHFSDPWTINPYKSYRFKWQYNLNRKLEQYVLEYCDTITVTSDKTKVLFEKKFSFLQNKIVVLPHTFDKRVYKIFLKNDDKKIVVHTGNIYGLRTVKYFLEGLSKIKLSNIEFHFYGKIKESEIELIKKYGLENMVKIYSQIPYLKSLEVISKADYLMVVDAPLDNSPFFPSKLADYIGASKPIIALSPKNSATCDILKNIDNNNLIASSDSVQEIQEMLLRLRYEKKEYKNIEYYSMENYDLLKDVFEK